jgi:hypothetical protein
VGQFTPVGRHSGFRGPLSGPRVAELGKRQHHARRQLAGPPPAKNSKKLTSSGVRLLDTAKPGEAGGVVAHSYLSVPFMQTRSDLNFDATSAGYL